MSHSEFPEYPIPQDTVPTATQSPDSPLEPEKPPTPNPRKRWSIIVGSILLIGGLGFGWRWWHNGQAASSQSGAGAMAGQLRGVPVKLETLESDSVQDASEFSGTLEAPKSVGLKPQIEGRISEILVKEGDRIPQGQAVIRLESDNAQAQLAQAKAALETSRARLAELKAGTRQEEIAQARARLTQAQAQLTNAQGGARPEEIAQAQAQIEAAKSDLELAQSRAKRYASLRQEGAVSQDQLEGYLTEQRGAAAKLQEAQRRLEQLRKGRSSDIDQLAAAVEQARQNLKELENGPRQEEIAQARSQVTQAAAQVRANQVQLQYTNVLAPFTGIVGDIPVKIGDFVDKGDELTTLTKNDSLELNLSIPINQAQQLRLGLPVQILDAQGKPTTTGKISFISPNTSANSQTVLAKATFVNAGGKLLNQQIVQAKVIWQERPGILIPVTAVSRLGGENFVFVAQPPAKPQPGMPALVAVQKPVQLGAIEGSNYQVIEGLQAGDKIVVSGILNLTNGAPITPEPQK